MVNTLVRSLLAAGFTALLSGSCAADSFATVEIYSLPEAVACAPEGYAATCRTITAQHFDRMKTSGRLGERHQLISIPPELARYGDNLIRSSRLYAKPLPETLSGRRSAIMAIEWKATPPKRVTIRRLDLTTNELISNDYDHRLGPGRFFYHFSFDYVGRYILEIETRSPNKILTFRE